MSNPEQSRAYVNANGSLKSTILCCISSSKNEDVMNIKKNDNGKKSKVSKEKNDDQDLDVIVEELSKEVIIESISELNSLKETGELTSTDQKKKTSKE